MGHSYACRGGWCPRLPHELILTSTAVRFRARSTDSRALQSVSRSCTAVTASVRRSWRPMQRRVTASTAVFCGCYGQARKAERKGCSGTAGPPEYCVSGAAGGGCGRDNGCWPDTPLSLQGPLSTFRLPAARCPSPGTPHDHLNMPAVSPSPALYAV